MQTRSSFCVDSLVRQIRPRPNHFLLRCSNGLVCLLGCAHGELARRSGDRVADERLKPGDVGRGSTWQAQLSLSAMSVASNARRSGSLGLTRDQLLA